MKGGFELFGYWRSSASWRLRWALELKQIPFTYTPVNLLEGEHKSEPHLKRNPSGKVPVLKTSDGELLTQSMAQLEFLEEEFPTPALLPQSTLERARCRALCEVINADVAPLQTPFIQKRHSSDSAEQVKWAQEWISKGFDAYQGLLPKSNGPFSLGENLTLCDLFLVPQIYNALRYKLEVEEKWPQLFKIYQHCLGLDECLKSSPEKQIDAVKN